MTWAGKYTSVLTVVTANVCVLNIKDERLVSARIMFAFWETGQKKPRHLKLLVGYLFYKIFI